MRVARYSSPREAVAQTPKDSGLLILADRYPEAPVLLSERFISEAQDKNIRTYVEYSSPKTASAPAPLKAGLERAVVTGQFFGPRLPALRILSLHQCWYLPLANASDPAITHLSLATVAGFDTAIFGLPAQGTHPLLVEEGGAGLLRAAGQLSCFVTARYEPVAAWTSVWQGILRWVLRASDEAEFRWTPVVRPVWSRSRSLSGNAERLAFTRGVQWYYNARLFIHPSWAYKLEEARKYKDQVAPAPSRDLPVGDGKFGLLEGHSSRILPDGSQPMRWWIRSDCVGETAMVLSLAGRLNPHSGHGRVARNLLTFLLNSKTATGLRLDTGSASYGLIGWNETPDYYKGENGYDVYYGDDNARCLLGILTASSLTQDSIWEERFWLAVLANFRLIGTLGFQKSRYDQAPLQKNGWQFYHQSPIILRDMNYQAYPWALFLWAFAKTGYRPFLERVEQGIRLTVQGYPNKWRWSNSITSQQARILLPLAWLVRVKDSPESRSWLVRIAEDLIAHQDGTGAIREWLGPRNSGIQMPPASNEQYGKSEGTLIERDGDPAADLLYTMNFAFIGLHEAYAATRDRRFKEAEDRIANFLARVQVASERHPEFDGAWFRAFDFQAWDYWASNSDSGWGAWCTESGWSQSWISTVFGLRLLNRSLWDLVMTARKFPEFDQLRKRMLA